MNTVFNKQRGFIALMSVIVVSLILLSEVFMVSGSSLLVRFDMLDYENKKQSVLSAQSCRNSAILKLQQNYFYLPTSQEIVDSESVHCIVQSIEHSFENTSEHTKIITIISQGKSGNSYTSLITKVNLQNPFFSHPFSSRDVVFMSEKEFSN